jgi:hypothetical protein
MTDSKFKPSFNDKACYDAETKHCASIRDGVQMYHGSELGQDEDRMFSVYRSPDTVTSIINSLEGLKVTNDHVPLKEISDSDIVGDIFDSEIVEHFDNDTDTTMLIRNGINISDDLKKLLDSGKRELSLGYFGDMVKHEVYDFEVVNVEPHHLAVVDAARCGSACVFEDKETNSMKLKTLFVDAGIIKVKDAEGDVSGDVTMQEVLEMVKKELPDLLETASLSDLQDIGNALKEMLASISTKEEADKPAQEGDENTEGQMDGDMKTPPEDDKMNDKKWSDKSFADAVAKQADEKVQVILKAKQFLGDSYKFDGKDTKQIMKDAIATIHDDEFEDTELKTVFKTLRKVASYDGFGRGGNVGNPLLAMENKEI